MEEKRLLAQLNELLVAEEGLLKQKSRIKWLLEGDQNTRYFHQVIKGRLSRNTIKNLTASDGSLLYDTVAIKNEVLNHYEALLGSDAPACSDLTLQGLVTVTLNDDY